MAIFYKITHEEANFDLIPQGAEYDALMPILKKALAKDIDQRYQTAYEFAVELREWLKVDASTPSTQNLLEALVDLEAPTHPPMPMTEAPGMTFTPEGGAPGPTVDVGRRLPRKGTIAPTRAGGRTVVDSGAAGAVRPAVARAGTAPVPRLAPRPQPAPKTSVLPWAAATVALVAVGVAGLLAFKSQRAADTPPVKETVATPVPPPTTLATPEPPPVTLAPAPAFEEAEGKAAAQIRTAQSAFKAGSYDRAVEAEQEALRADPANESARKVLANARKGRRPSCSARRPRRRSPEAISPRPRAARGRRRFSPWDRSIADLSSRIAEEKSRAQRDADARAQSRARPRSPTT